MAEVTASIVLVDGNDLTALSRDEMIALIVDLASERDALAALQPGISHGMVRVRVYIDPQVSREQAREMKGQLKEPL